MLLPPYEQDEIPTPQPTTTTLPNISAANDILSQSYFESPEAHILFGFIKDKNDNKDIDEIDLKNVINCRIAKLTEGYSTPNGWKSNVDDFDGNGVCTAFDIHKVQMKCRYLATSLRIALTKMVGAGGTTWHQCCEEAMQMVNKVDGNCHILRFYNKSMGHSRWYARVDSKRRRLWGDDFRDCFERVRLWYASYRRTACDNQQRKKGRQEVYG